MSNSLGENSRVSSSTLKNAHIGATVLHLIQAGYGFAITQTIFKNESSFNLANPVATYPGQVNDGTEGGEIILETDVMRQNNLWSYDLAQVVPVFRCSVA